MKYKINFDLNCIGRDGKPYKWTVTWLLYTSGMFGSEANDPYEIQDGAVHLKSNNNGGVLGGITSGAPLVFAVCLLYTSRCV